MEDIITILRASILVHSQLIGAVSTWAVHQSDVPDDLASWERRRCIWRDTFFYIEKPTRLYLNIHAFPEHQTQSRASRKTTTLHTSDCNDFLVEMRLHRWLCRLQQFCSHGRGRLQHLALIHDLLLIPLWALVTAHENIDVTTIWIGELPCSHAPSWDYSRHNGAWSSLHRPCKQWL